MTYCPKCSGYKISGPFYKIDKYGKETLQYICNKCKYSKSEPTHDAKEESDLKKIYGSTIVIKT